MFCKNCGKDIGEDKFCRYCGSSNEDNKSKNDAKQEYKQVLNELLNDAKTWIEKQGCDKLIEKIGIVCLAINIIIRIVYDTIYFDYYTNAIDRTYYNVVSKTGKSYMIFVLALQVVLSVILSKTLKKDNKNVPSKTIAIAVATLVIQIIAMLLKFPVQ